LNALNMNMVAPVRVQLRAWAGDPAVTRIIIKGAGDRAFCAGGDIRALHDMGKAGELDHPRAFWREEYTLNYELRTYPKPVLALIDGIVMGGGVGMSLHGSHRVASEKLMFAMPEVGIGFFPDVGASYVLPRLPDHIGRYLALTGARIGQADAMMLGLATDAVPSAHMAEIEEALTSVDPVDAILARYRIDPDPAPIAAHADEIRSAFGADSVGEIIERLDRAAIAGSAFAATTAAAMRTKSPTTMAIALEQMKRGLSMTFAEAMRMDYRIVNRIAVGHDFYEGVRAVIIDKDQNPRWKPATVDAVDPAAVAAHFEPVPDDLVLG
ncbi:MAG: enoyl-CoA hydratase/isomerase family protein, partial [Beijerinckiaceae bacterium]